jgi:hypothetical protein
MKTTFSLTHSGMGDLLLLVHSVMKICLVVGVMVLVATWPASSAAAKVGARAGDHLFTSLLPSSAANYYVSANEGESAQDLDFTWLTEADTGMEPMSLMETDEPATHDSWTDVSTQAHDDRWGSSSDVFEPAFNIDGTMMVGSFDTNGNMYGVTDCHCDSWDSSAAMSMWDD